MVNFSKNTEGSYLEVIVPSCTTATVYMPSHSNKIHLFINGKQVNSVAKNGFYKVENVKVGKHTFVLK
jgi:hypothetical protein